MTNQILFLDIDGVLNCGDGPAPGNPLGLGKQQMKCLVMILDALPDCGIVITSSWRTHLDLEALRSIFAGHRIPPERVVGATPVLSGGDRGDEIHAWLRANPGMTSFVILDDDPDMGTHVARLVRTYISHGLTRKNAERAIAMFGEMT